MFINVEKALCRNVCECVGGAVSLYYCDYSGRWC